MRFFTWGFCRRLPNRLLRGVTIMAESLSRDNETNNQLCNMHIYLYIIQLRGGNLKRFYIWAPQDDSVNFIQA
jgi:hypothetical protein